MGEFEANVTVDNEQAMRALAASLARHCQARMVIFLQGDLGAGKTTFARGFLQALGVTGAVKSPTYTLLEHYQTDLGQIAHFDLYRLQSAQELEFIGLDDYLADCAVCLFEWPECGQGELPVADLTCYIAHEQTARRLTFSASTDLGRDILTKFRQDSSF